MPGAVLVTGGGRRLGAAIARAVAAAGFRVVIHHNRSSEEAAALAGEIGGATVRGDLADLAGLDALFGRAVAAAGEPILGLVNSASLFEFDRPPQVDVSLAARLYAVNTLAPVRLAEALARQEAPEGGAVVNLLDQKVANPNPDFFSYTLTKVALEGATTLLAQALAPRVRVNAVAPGLTLPSGDQSAAEFADTATRNLLHREVGAEQVAAAVVYLLGARSVTGQTLFVDSGQRFLKREGDVMFEGRADA
ncbi:SDR family oxidoreductase [Sphingomonas aracearum]|uniref:SDR family NAD(P)-dependent oxidoreductase n=1 Tax=Sphingomonas aracearum TaxID=2283317 RepID=A0A369VVR9_9SPHN|nr:SDR family oxidoreductase [Sphingomonas aracearum]RDE05270.1 SDR family NAD(P)-dependent oxidoreductase [Sphingomonas aracearum]